MKWIKQAYLDLSWWADGIRPVRWLKCLFGFHTPIAIPTSYGYTWACGYCWEPLAGDSR